MGPPSSPEFVPLLLLLRVSATGVEAEGRRRFLLGFPVKVELLDVGTPRWAVLLPPIPIGIVSVDSLSKKAR